MTTAEKAQKLRETADFNQFQAEVIAQGYVELQPTLSKIGDIFSSKGNDYAAIAADPNLAKTMRDSIALIGKRAPYIAKEFRPKFGGYRGGDTPAVKPVAVTKPAPKAKPIVEAKMAPAGYENGDILITKTSGERFTNYRFWKLDGNNVREVAYDTKKLDKNNFQVQPSGELKSQTGKFKDGKVISEGVSPFSVVGKFDGTSSYVNHFEY